MSDITISIKGPLLKPAHQAANSVEEVTNDILRTIIDSTTDKMVKYFKDLIITRIERSVEIAAFVGQNSDPEVIRSIINGIKVEKTPTQPPSISIEFKNEFGAWYGEPPKELLEMIKGVIDSALGQMSDIDMNKMCEELVKE